HCGWFEALLAELKLELWLGDPATIRSKRVRKQKHDREDARLLLRLLRNGECPRIWIPDMDNRDLRQLLGHRHRTGADADAGAEPTASDGAECRHKAKETMVEPSGTRAIAGSGTAALEPAKA